ncbi:MAG: hypothetical protein AAGE94_03905 [Acidobacteriota bacterium]
MDDAPDDTSNTPEDRTAFIFPRVLAIGLGAALTVAAWRFETSLPRGPAEFAFWPALEPMPFAAIRGLTVEQWSRLLTRLVVLGPALLLLSWGFAAIPWPRWRGSRPTSGVVAFAVASLGLTFGAWFQLGVLQGRALVEDELTYAWQAELLAEGRLTEDRARWGPESFTIWTEHGATGKYLFGEPLIQIVGVLLGLPALLHLPLLALACVLWFRTVTALASPRVATLATTLLALSPMVLLVSATGLSHTSSLAAMIGLGWGLVALRHAIDRGHHGWLAGLVAGSALGFGVTVRPQVAVSFGAVLAACFVIDAWRDRRRWALVSFVAAGLPWLAALLLYNQHLTGSALALPWSLASPAESFGFGTVLAGSDYVHTPWRALVNLGMVAFRLNAFLLGWPLSLGLLLVWWRVGRPAAGVAPWLLAGSAQIVFHLGYYTPGISGFGALYHLELVLPFTLLGALALDRALTLRPRLTSTTLVVHLMLGTGGFLAEQSGRLERMVSMLHDQPSAVLAAIDPPALLIYEAWPSESVHLGWIGSGFPTRTRSDRSAIVTYPRSGPASVASLRRLYADRACWYSRVDPTTFRPDLRPCAAAEALLARPFRLDGPKIAIRPTAMTRGWLLAPGEQPDSRGPDDTDRSGR